MSSVSAIILAAGASSRMGRPKAFLLYRGETFLSRWIRLFRVYCEDVIVVSGGELDAKGARLVVNPDPSRGMLSSLQCGLRAVGEAARAVVFTPVDVPAVRESTIDQLVRGWSGELLRLPRYSGRRGHPALVARELFPEFLDLPPESETRTVVRNHAQDITYIDVDDPGILNDVDTPFDYERLR